VPSKSVVQRIDALIHEIRSERVMLDADLATLYGVSTAGLNQAVDRNADRFPDDFCFRLTTAEIAALKSQSVISIRGRGGRRSRPRAFTEHGVAMLSSVLHSQRAIAVNILVVRTFIQLRRRLSQTARLGHRMDEIERRIDVHSSVLQDVLEALRALERPAPQPSREIGFRPKT
jgi:2-phospho-L-lactate guanylyltransferase (CobY/MobA/RfbA family)